MTTNTTRKTFAPLAALTAAGLLLTGCGSHNDARWVQMCADRYGAPLPDYQCDSPAGLYPLAMPYYLPWNTWHDQVEIHHHYHPGGGDRFTGGTTTRPASTRGDVRIQSNANPNKVTLYAKGKQAGVSVKMNHDAKKVGTVTKQQKSSYGSSFKSSGGYTSKKSNSFGSSFKSSGSSSSYRRK